MTPMWGERQEKIIIAKKEMISLIDKQFTANGILLNEDITTIIAYCSKKQRNFDLEAIA